MIDDTFAIRQLIFIDLKRGFSFRTEPRVYVEFESKPYSIEFRKRVLLAGEDGFVRVYTIPTRPSERI